MNEAPEGAELGARREISKPAWEGEAAFPLRWGRTLLAVITRTGATFATLGEAKSSKASLFALLTVSALLTLRLAVVPDGYQHLEIVPIGAIGSLIFIAVFAALFHGGMRLVGEPGSFDLTQRASFYMSPIWAFWALLLALLVRLGLPLWSGLPAALALLMHLAYACHRYASGARGIPRLRAALISTAVATSWCLAFFYCAYELYAFASGLSQAGF